MGKGNRLPYVGMMMAEIAQVGLMIVSKVAMSDGMPSLIFICYSNALASLLLLPFIFFFHRPQLQSLTLPLFSSFFLLALLGFAAQVLGYSGLYYSSPTLGTALLNLIPGFTFLFALLFRIEKLHWRSPMFWAKSIGTMVSVTGALLVTLYQGPPILSMLSVISRTDSPPYNLFTQQRQWVIGGLLLIASCVMSSSWLISQAYVLKRYPVELIVVFYYCAFVALQSAALILITEKDFSAWSLVHKVRLKAILYSAIFGSAFQVGVSSWCLHKKGPVFVSMFKPVGIVIAVVFGVIFSKDTFYLGSLIGIIVIIFGFYSVMWGKANEEKQDSASGLGLDGVLYTSQETLLQHK